MKKRVFVYLIFALLIAFGACNEPVFYIISVEPPISEPLIDGSPTNFAVFKNQIYVASGRSIHTYNGTKWDLMPSKPGGRILQLAATDSYLYALCFQDSDGSTNLKRYSTGDWKDVTGDTGGYNMLQSVYAANDKVFIGAEKNGGFIILYMADSDGAYSPLTPGSTADTPEYMLCGAAFDGTNYYLCTRDDTIFRINAAGVLINSKKLEKTSFTGIINIGINNIILAISRDGNLYNVNAGANITKLQNISLGDRPSTGALAVWRDSGGTPKLLLAGRQDRLDYAVDSGYIYGYMELEFDSGGIKAGSDFVEPGKNTVSSVKDYERYVSTIRKYPVNHIFQTPKNIDGNMTLFASTQKNGVWSYRVRGGIPQWNAEE